MQKLHRCSQKPSLKEEGDLCRVFVPFSFFPKGTHESVRVFMQHLVERQRKGRCQFISLILFPLSLPVAVCCTLPVAALFYLLCIGATGVCGGEGAERAAEGGVLVLPSPSAVGPEPLRTEPSRSANFAAAGFERKEKSDIRQRALKWKVGHIIVAIQMSKLSR